MTAKKGRGGKRPGAGRPVEIEDPVAWYLRTTRAQRDKADRLRRAWGLASRAAVVRRLLDLADETPKVSACDGPIQHQEGPMTDPIEAARRRLHSANEELHRLVEPSWVTLAAAAEYLGVSKGSVSDAVRRRAIRSVRLLPGEGRGSVLVLLDPESVKAYRPRGAR